MDTEYMKSMKKLQQEIESITKKFKFEQASVKMLSSKLKIKTPSFEKISNIGLNISNIMPDYFTECTKLLRAFHEILSIPGLSAKINGRHVDILNNFYWVIPFEYKYENLNKLSKYKDIKEYETYMLRYFNDNRIKRMFSKIIRQCKEKDKKVLLKQVERAFFNEDYAICMTTLITLLDGLTLSLLSQDSECQHLSHRAIEALLEYINECPFNEFGYELYLKVDILNNFYTILYKYENNFKNSKSKNLSRHLSSHGIKYLNTKIDTLRLLNAIYFCQEILNETEMQEQFLKDKKSKKFIKK